MRLTIGYPDHEAERRILIESSRVEELLDRVEAVLVPARILDFQAQVDQVRADSSLVDFLQEIIRRTRVDPRLQIGVSPRGAVALFKAARAYAMVQGRTFLAPDDILTVGIPCLAHRLLPTGTAASTAEAHQGAAVILEDILKEVPVPV
jgi:MoxR-like ATPase